MYLIHICQEDGQAAVLLIFLQSRKRIIKVDFYSYSELNLLKYYDIIFIHSVRKLLLCRWCQKGNLIK